jgi:two-component system, cell cycle sensor histidine kinase and response regulator CckA
MAQMQNKKYQPAQQPAPSQPSFKRQEIRTVLLMDDEVDFLEIFSQLLQSLEYATVCTKNGSEVLRYLLSKPEGMSKFSAVFLDLTVPGEMGGRETIGEIRKIDKAIPVFVTSGYADDPIIIDPPKYGFTAGLIKPFKIQELEDLLNKYVMMTA